MSMLLEGRTLARKLQGQLQNQILNLKILPTLGVILVGDNPASHIYVNAKKKAAVAVGIKTHVFHLSPTASSQEVEGLIRQLNNDPSIHGILLQLPLPRHLDEFQLTSLISPAKDVDGLTPVNQGKLFLGASDFVPCTPLGIMSLIRLWKENLEGLAAVVIGRSKLVGKPVAMLLLQEGCTVTIAHSKTRNLPHIAKTADILIAAVGQPYLVKADWIKPGACVIDVGINKEDIERENPTIKGDVDFEAASKIAGAISPVPGGVGPMTITFLLKNVVKACMPR